VSQNGLVRPNIVNGSRWYNGKTTFAMKARIAENIRKITANSAIRTAGWVTRI
jgi:hypothetical protein